MGAPEAVTVCMISNCFHVNEIDCQIILYRSGNHYRMKSRLQKCRLKIQVAVATEKGTSNRAPMSHRKLVGYLKIYLEFNFEIELDIFKSGGKPRVELF